MKFQIGKNGITFSLENKAERVLAQDMLDNAAHKDHGFLSELLDKSGWSPNGQLFVVQPEWIGALTDAPIITDGWTMDDDGVSTVDGNVWWFPRYEHESFAEVLIKTGQVFFPVAA